MDGRLRWRAVGFGVAVVGLLAFFAALVPLAGHLAVGAAAGFVAGLLGGGGSAGGFRNGSATGLVGGLLALLLVGIVAVTFGLGAAPLPTVRVGPLVLLGETYTGAEALTVAAVGSALLAGAAVLGGLAGALLRGDRPLPAGQ
jgi:hypothetical protein